MRFNVEPEQMRPRVTPVYRSQDFAFDVEPKPESGGASVLVNDVQLEVDEDGVVLYAWGLCPHTTWSETCDALPTTRRGMLRAELPDDFTPGTSIRVNRERWPVAANPETGWVRIGESSAVDDCIEFADGMVACLAAGRLVSLWIHLTTMP
ncbi:MAG: hypothetical protein MJE77_37495 [Proteobacteria bacterium]|nr:hypothetical protein [Pseudomonadota bacterium]